MLSVLACRVAAIRGTVVAIVGCGMPDSYDLDQFMGPARQPLRGEDIIRQC